MTLARPRLLRDLQVAGLHVEEVEPVRAPRVWRASGPAGAFVVRWAPVDEAEALGATLRWAHHLSSAGVPVPAPWHMRGTTPSLVEAAGGRALVHRWTEGTQVSETGWDEDSAQAMGGLLAAAHLAAERAEDLSVARLQGKDAVHRYDRAWVDEAWDASRLEGILPAASADEWATVNLGIEAAARVLTAAWSGGPGGPVVMVHADVHAGNVLVLDTESSARRGDQRPGREAQPPRLALIDLGRVGLAPVALDLAIALLEHEDSTAWALLRAYRHRRALDESFEDVYSAFRVLAMVDNLRFLAAIEQERAFIEASWPGLVSACTALLGVDR